MSSASPDPNANGARFAHVAAEAIATAHATESVLPEDFAGNRQGNTLLTARFARLPSGGELRSVHIHGPRVEIINLFYFPDPQRALPIYAMELVMFGSRPVVGVIDSKPLCVHPYATALWRHVMQAAQFAHAGLVYAENPPGWYRECRSGLDFYTRPATAEAMGELLACHSQVWQQLVHAEQAAPLLEPEASGDHRQALADYKDHHRHNSPGLPFLQRSFGTEWTQRFLRHALFA